MEDIDSLELPPGAVKLITKALRAAFRKGRQSAESRFDALLDLHLGVKCLNGSTELFKHAWEEGKHKRDHGKFATKEGGESGTSDLSATAISPQPVRGSPVADVAPDSSATTRTTFSIPEEHLLSGLHSEVPPGLWGVVKDKVVRAAAKVHERLVLATPALLKLQDVLTTVFDHPDDLKRLGYQPTTSGLAGHETPDALREHVGIGGTLGARLASHVLAKVVSWIRSSAAVGKAADETGDPYVALGSALADVFTILAAEFGGTAPGAATVAEALRGMVAESAASPPAPPVATEETEESVGKAWKSEDHPRDDSGRFIDAHDLHAATTDPKVAAELRARVTKPEERRKLDEAIGVEEKPATEPPAVDALHARLEARNRSTKHGEVNALLRDVAKLTDDQARELLRRDGFPADGPNPRHQLAETIHDRQASKIRQGLVGPRNSPDRAEFEAMNDEPLASVEDVLGAKPKAAAKKPGKAQAETPPKAAEPPPPPPATDAGKFVVSVYEGAARVGDDDVESAKKLLASLPAEEVARVAAATGHYGPATSADVMARIIDRRGAAIRGKLIGRPDAPAAQPPAPPVATTPASTVATLKQHLERAKTEPEAVAKDADGILARLQAEHSPAEILAIANEVSGGNATKPTPANVKAALKKIRNDLTAVSRALESQRV